MSSSVGRWFRAFSPWRGRRGRRGKGRRGGESSRCLRLQLEDTCCLWAGTLDLNLLFLIPAPFDSFLQMEPPRWGEGGWRAPSGPLQRVCLISRHQEKVDAAQAAAASLRKVGVLLTMNLNMAADVHQQSRNKSTFSFCLTITKRIHPPVRGPSPPPPLLAVSRAAAASPAQLHRTENGTEHQ